VKTAALIFALFLFVKPVLPFLEYAAFYDYIKNELCENKDVPELQCNGKCHLKKELAKASNSDNNSEKSHHYTAEQTIVFFQNISHNYVLFFSNNDKLKINTGYNNSYTYYYSNFVFQPPLV